ncbi:MAG TPA: hypothetical protein QF644_04425 [Candidatus Poseidoniaceae archaeon]|nr:hypothetical protein [Candidatus Poseidoniaceae archaeon]
MPYVKPPLGGPIGRSRMRLSASSLVAWERGKRDWFLKYKIALKTPKNPEMILGIIIEEALIGLMMESPSSKHIPEKSIWASWMNDVEYVPTDNAPVINSISDLRKWINKKIPDAAKVVWNEGKIKWEKSIYKREDREWEDVGIHLIEKMLTGGIELFLEEITQCFEKKGGPHLEKWRLNGDPFPIPAPCWHKKATHPIPEKVPKHLESNFFDNKYFNNPFTNKGEPNLKEVWEITRPWAKDPRVWQPQRLYHQEGWASGEMDLMLRWEENAKIVDIKASDGKSKYSVGLPIQLRFYGWLIQEIKRISGLKFELSGLEGWYLKVPFRKMVDLIHPSELPEETQRLKNIWKEQQETDRVNSKCPIDGEFNLLSNSLESITPKRWKGESLETICKNLEPEYPYSKILSIPDRLNVKGNISGKWGPLNNHFGELVHGALISNSKRGTVNLTLEESQPNSHHKLSELTDGEYVILDAMPGIWRDMARLYVDEKSKIIPIEEYNEGSQELTRLGRILTKTDIQGLVVSRSLNSGKRLDGRPWTMESCHLWDGEAIIELVAFGSAIGGKFSSLICGDLVKVRSAELGWRNGIPQLRLNPRKTKFEIIEKEDSN